MDNNFHIVREKNQKKNKNNTMRKTRMLWLKYYTKKELLHHPHNNISNTSIVRWNVVVQPVLNTFWITWLCCDYVWCDIKSVHLYPIDESSYKFSNFKAVKVEKKKTHLKAELTHDVPCAFASFTRGNKCRLWNSFRKILHAYPILYQFITIMARNKKTKKKNGGTLLIK